MCVCLCMSVLCLKGWYTFWVAFPALVVLPIYDKRDNFNFDIVNFPYLNGDLSRSSSYDV